MLALRLRDAVNAHDLDALVACFATSYVNETPAHPSRGFRGREQVRTNWQQFFSLVPDLVAEVTRSARDGETEWSEWEMRGTRRDGSLHHMRGVLIFGTADDHIAWARFYLEPVDAGTSTIDDAVRTATTGAS